MSVILLDRISQPSKRRSQIDGREYWGANSYIQDASGILDLSSNLGGVRLDKALVSTRLIFDASNNMSGVGLLKNSGSPEGSISSGPGSLVFDETNGRLYVKETGTGTTGWVRVPTSDLKKVRKESDEAVTSSTTYQADDELKFAGLANEKWIYDFFVKYKGHGSGDLKYKIDGPSGVGITYFVQMLNASNTFVSTFGSSSNFSDNVAGAATPAHTWLWVHGEAVLSSTPGDVGLWWAQNVSNATATEVLIGSHLIAYKV